MRSCCSVAGAVASGNVSDTTAIKWKWDIRKGSAIKTSGYPPSGQQSAPQAQCCIPNEGVIESIFEIMKGKVWDIKFWAIAHKIDKCKSLNVSEPGSLTSGVTSLNIAIARSASPLWFIRRNPHPKALEWKAITGSIALLLKFDINVGSRYHPPIQNNVSLSNKPFHHPTLVLESNEQTQRRTRSAEKQPL